MRRARRLLPRVESGEIATLEDLPPGVRGRGLYEALLERSWELRTENPQAMVRLAVLAVRVAETFSFARLGAAAVADLQGRAWAELGNAYRVADRLEEAAEALLQAGAWYEHGTGDMGLGARLLGFEGSLAGERGQLAAAYRAFALLHKHYRDLGDRHLAGRALISQGLFWGYLASPLAALDCLAEGLSLIDAEREPGLTFTAFHNQIMILIDCRRYLEAKKLIFLNRCNLRPGGDRLNALRLRWEEGRNEAGLGRVATAERALREVKTACEELGSLLNTGLVALDLAAVLMLQGRAAEARVLVVEAARVFATLDRGAALEAALRLRDSFATASASAADVQAVAAFARRAQNEPLDHFRSRPMR